MAARQGRIKKPSAGKTGQLRIIGGRWRGRKLTVAASEGLRPTPDRVRETLFNWLAADIGQANCLDLFAGTGVLGLEALSRGASSCRFVDYSPAACRQLNMQLQKLSAQGATVEQTNAISWLDRYCGDAFDIVFIDPPYHLGLAQQACQQLLTKELLNPGGVLYVEMAIDEAPPPCLASWLLHREKTAGQVCYRLYVQP